jgi:hypothetical protein
MNLLPSIKGLKRPDKAIVSVNTTAGVRKLLGLAQELSLSHIGVEFAFTYDAPDVYLKDKIIHDIRSIHPQKVAIVLAEPQSPGKTTFYRFVVDLSRPELVKKLQPLFTLPVPFVG